MGTVEQTIVVTGAAGFIGSHVVAALLTGGTRVVGIDNFDPYYARRIKEANLLQAAAQANTSVTSSAPFELCEQDICNGHAMRELFERVKPNAVIHLAARAGVRPSIADPVEWSRVNVLGTTVLLHEAARVRCDRFVMASSSSIYGNNKKTPFAEIDPVGEPISPYASTKRSCELLGFTHHHLTGMPTACLRFFTVYGPRQRPDLAIAKFMGLLRDGNPITMYGDGSMSRDYTYIDDIVQGVLAALDRIDAFGYRVWNLGSDHPVRLDALIEEIATVTGITPRINHEAVFAGDVERTWADLSRSRAELDYVPSMSRMEGLRRQWATIDSAHVLG